ncbi:MAG: hypothetical protein ABI378_00680 [Chitinophagaceae bacterium]
MKSKIAGDTLEKKMYHTQERRLRRLSEPKPCGRANAWLGCAYYFWYDERDAHFWGNNSKRETGYFEIYSASIDTEDLLDTVFNEEQYLFWVKQIEFVATKLKKSGKVVSLKSINEYFYEKGIWSDVSGILFQDISGNPDNYLVNNFQYKKRIQLAVFDLKIVSNFALDFEGQCV